MLSKCPSYWSVYCLHVRLAIACGSVDPSAVQMSVWPSHVGQFTVHMSLCPSHVGQVISLLSQCPCDVGQLIILPSIEHWSVCRLYARPAYTGQLAYQFACTLFWFVSPLSLLQFTCTLFCFLSPLSLLQFTCTLFWFLSPFSLLLSFTLLHGEYSGGGCTITS